MVSTAGDYDLIKFLMVFQYAFHVMAIGIVFSRV